LANIIAYYYLYYNRHVICYATVGEKSCDDVVGAHGLESDNREEYK